MADSRSQKLFGGSVSFTGFGQMASKTGGLSPAVFGSISAVGNESQSTSSAFVSTADASSVFGSSATVVGFGDLASSGSGVAAFSKKSG